MKRSLYLISVVTVMSLILAACNLPAGTGSSDATQAPVEIQPPAATEPPVAATGLPATVEPTPELVPVNLAGPPMELGSKYRYVDGTVLVAVPGGEFTMGYNSVDNPTHLVTLSDFWIYSTKVTNQQYALCVNAGKCAPPDSKNNPEFGDYRVINFPVTGVNYEQAAAYCSFVHGRLPTEAEWEKTARGPDANLFPWGNEGPVCDLLNYKFCEGKTTEINDYPNGVSYYGAFDMSGNAREWAADWYSPTYYSESPLEDPLGPVIGEKRSVRGSSYQDSADPSISAHRFSLLPIENLPDLGFRCIVEDPTYFAPACEQIPYIGTGPNGEEANCTPVVECNSVKISQSPNCTGKPNYIPYTIVTFSLSDTPPNDWSFDVPGCSSPVGGEANKFQCDLPGSYTASAQGTCVDTKSCVSACPANYQKVGDTCVWDGKSTNGTACIYGTVYDPLTHCCSADPASTVSYNICPAGFYPLNGTCVQSSKKSVDSQLETVVFDTKNCHPPLKRDPGDEACVEPYLRYCYITTNGKLPYWNPVTCACQSTPP